MLRCLPALMLALVLVSATGCNTAQKTTQVQQVQQEGETRIYEVFGMDCPGCHGGLHKLVMKIPAVERVEASWKEKQLIIFVKAGEELDDASVEDAITRANFTIGKRLK